MSSDVGRKELSASSGVTPPTSSLSHSNPLPRIMSAAIQFHHHMPCVSHRPHLPSPHRRANPNSVGVTHVWSPIRLRALHLICHLFTPPSYSYAPNIAHPPYTTAVLTSCRLELASILAFKSPEASYQCVGKAYYRTGLPNQELVDNRVLLSYICIRGRRVVG
jgi:hypothetical protein